jgi:hypothetical protein
MIDISRGIRRAMVALAATVLLPVLAACTVNIGAGAGAASSSAARSTASSPAPSEPDRTGSPSAGDGQNSVTRVHCTASSCTITLSGDSQVTVLGTSLSLTSVQGGRATLDVGGQSVSCAQGESVSAGGLTLQCTAVGDGSVSFTATRG